MAQVGCVVDKAVGADGGVGAALIVTVDAALVIHVLSALVFKQAQLSQD